MKKIIGQTKARNNKEKCVSELLESELCYDIGRQIGIKCTLHKHTHIRVLEPARLEMAPASEN